MDYGTRQFREFHRVALDNDDFCEIQSAPYSDIIEADKCIVRVVNERLYTPSMWNDLTTFLDEFGLDVVSISRVDLCGDFNRFNNYECIPFIKDFLAGVIRHKGRGKGASYFDHRAKIVNGCSRSYVKYSGLSFGANNSDVRVYLYNKTFELQTVKDKPYIKQLWRETGLDVTRDVWRLEVSIKSGGRKFKDFITGAKKEITHTDLTDVEELEKLYFTFVQKYFAFIKNRPNITNITREPLLELFGLHDLYIHRVIPSQSGGDRMERIIIKKLWQMADTYRGNDICTDEGLTKDLAVGLAKTTGLDEWLIKKSRTWEKPRRK